MIRPIDIKLNAAHPELPLVEATTFTGAPSSVFIRGVPKSVGNWSITAVSVAVTYPDNTTTARAAVESAEGVWVATIPGTATSGRTTAGFRILADGIDENGAAVTGYVLGFADFAVLSFFPVPAPGETFFYLRYFDTMPTTAKKMDVTTIDGALKYYNGTTWLPFTDLSNYYTKAETDNAIERVAAYYITYNAAGAAFPTRADLLNAQTYYSGGVVRVPTRNDYAVVLADETHGGAEWRYIYAVADGETTGQWEAQYPVEGVITYDNTVTPTSGNGVKSSGIWSAIWGALAALPTGFSSLYDWCVAHIAKLRDKLDLAVYERRCVVSFPAGYSITYGGDTYSTEHAESIEFYGPISSTAVPQYNFWVPYEYKDATDFDPQAQAVWCLFGDIGDSFPYALMYRTGATYSIANWNTEAPTLTLSNGEATGGEPTMARPVGATGDTLAKVSQMNTALAGKQDALSQTQLDNIAAVPNKANASDLRYALVAAPSTTNGTTQTVTLADRANSSATQESGVTTVALTFPTATSGKARDFGLRLTVASGVTTAPELALPQGVTCENADGEAPEIGADGAATILYFTETASGVFLVKGEVVTAIS